MTSHEFELQGKFYIPSGRSHAVYNVVYAFTNGFIKFCLRPFCELTTKDTEKLKNINLYDMQFATLKEYYFLNSIYG